jgi:hypothetical protein
MSDRDPIDLSDDLPPADLAALSGLLSDPTVWDEPDPGLEDIVVAAIVAEAAAGAGAGDADVRARADRDDAARSTSSRRSGGRRSAGRGRSRGGRSGLVLLGGAAAAAVLIVVVVAVAAVRKAPQAGVEHLALRPAAGAPATAVGDAELEERADGTRILLDVHGLPPAAPGTYYEAWLRQNKEVGVSAGSFHLHGGGTEQIELWAAVSPKEYPLFTVTLQQEDAGAESSGVVFLSGRLG